MKKQKDRVMLWRERQKTEGKSSITVMLSQETRVILTEEKEKTGESYAVIVEKALQTLKKKNHRLYTPTHLSKRDEVLTRASAKAYQSSVTPATSHESGGQPKLMVDDLVNYPSIEDIEREQAEKKRNANYDLKLKEGLFTRLIRSSSSPFGRKKKWFK